MNEEMATNAEIGHSVDTGVQWRDSDSFGQHSQLSQEQTISTL